MYRLATLALLTFALPMRAADPADAIKSPTERAAWKEIADRFEGAQTLVPGKGKEVSIRVEGLKGQKPASGTASVQVDADGRVTNVTSNAAGFTNDEFKLFAAFPELTSLTLWHNGKIDSKAKSSPHDGTGLAHLTGLKKFGRVTLAGGGLSDAGLAAAAKLPALTELHMWHSSFTDVGFTALRDHPTLEVVRMGPMWLPDTTDKTLEVLGTCPRLRSLQVSETYLTWDGGLRHLAGLKGLKSLDLKNCLIDPADVEKAKAAMPGAVVAWEGLAGAGATLAASPFARGKAEKWMPKELLAKAAEVAKAPPAKK